MFSEGCDRGTISHLEGERVPNNRDILTEIICVSQILSSNFQA